jgi:hypothetical protein
MSDYIQPLADSLLARRYIDVDYVHVVPVGTPWEEALKVEYWARSFEKLRPGDTITVHSCDHAVVFEILVQDINPRVSPIFFMMQYRPLYPAGLELPAPPSMEPLKYSVRVMRGGGNLFEVVDELGDVKRDRMQRMDALDVCLALNSAVAEVQGKTVRSRADLPSGPMPGSRREADQPDEATRDRTAAERQRRHRDRLRDSAVTGAAK